MGKGFGGWIVIGSAAPAQALPGGVVAVPVDNGIAAGAQPNLTHMTALDRNGCGVSADLNQLRRTSTQLWQLAEDAAHAVGLVSGMRTVSVAPALSAALDDFNRSWTVGLRLLVADLELASESLLMNEREYLERDDDVASRLRALGKPSRLVLSRSFIG